MFVLARHTGESIDILDGMIEIKVLSVTGRIVRLGISAPREIPVQRKELTQQGAGHEQGDGS